MSADDSQDYRVPERLPEREPQRAPEPTDANDPKGPGNGEQHGGSPAGADVTPYVAGQASSVQAYVEPEFCAYCGAKLNSMFYFCVGCGTPFKTTEAVITPARPRKLSEEQLIKLKAPSAWPLFWTYFGVILGGGIICQLLFAESRPDLVLFLQTALIFVTTCVFAAMYWKSLAAQFKTIGFNQPIAWLCLGLLIPALVVNFVWHQFIQMLIESTGQPMQSVTDADLALATKVMIFCVFPAVTEEIAFRGLLQHWLQTAIKPWRAVVLASALFAGLHFSVLSMPYLFGLGVLMGWAKWKTGSLYPSILIHFLHNFAVVVFFPSA